MENEMLEKAYYVKENFDEEEFKIEEITKAQDLAVVLVMDISNTKN